MGVLKKPDRERMAQLMAKGKSAHIAFAEIRPNDKQPERNCGRFLKRYPEIEERVAELVNRELDRDKFVVTRAMEIAAVSKSYVLGNLKEIVERCMQSHPVFDNEGNPVFLETKDGKIAAQYGFDPKPAVAALRLLGMEAGMFVQRFAPVEDPFKHIPAAQVQAIMEALALMKTGRVIEHENTAPANKAAVASRVDRKSSSRRSRRPVSAGDELDSGSQAGAIQAVSEAG